MLGGELPPYQLELLGGGSIFVVVVSVDLQDVNSFQIDLTGARIGGRGRPKRGNAVSVPLAPRA
jgi:hypothetical protein